MTVKWLRTQRVKQAPGKLFFSVFLQQTPNRVLSGLVSTIITTCIIWIPVTAILFYILVRWIRGRKLSQYPHIREVKPGCRTPLVVGLFHPYCNAGGGGERVLWVAVRALQMRFPDLRCVIYTGDTDASGDEILAKAQQRFNIELPRPESPYLQFIFLHRRQWVEASPYPYFTLLGQSLGSIVLGMEAIFQFVPDIYFDTMGYAFTIPLFRYLGGCLTGCYIHYPTISTDMLERVSQRTDTYNNASIVSRSAFLSRFKLIYYHIFAYLYGVAGKRSQTVMVNSTWTRNHIVSLWGTRDRTHTVYPPCDTDQFLQLPLKREKNKNIIMSVSQFRPEKDHSLQLRSFHKFLSTIPSKTWKEYKLLLVGSCRNEEDETRVSDLKALSQKLGISDNVEFQLNISFDQLKKYMAEATVGLHTMWNEHFGIGVVELMASGSIILAHNSGGPKLDIVVGEDGEKVGYLADDEDTYSNAMKQIFSLSKEQKLNMQQAARKSVVRFSEKEFEAGFLTAVMPLISRAGH